MRTLTFELVPDPGSFTPLQLKPSVVLSAAMNGSQRWSRTFGVPVQIAVRDLQNSFVVRVARLKYLEKFTHFDLEQLTISVTRCSMKDGAEVECRNVFEPRPGYVVAEATLVMVPIALVESSGELAGLPAPMAKEYLEAFDPSERFSEPYRNPFPGVVSQIEETGELLGSYEHEFFVHRQHCEFVDQWFFVEAANFAAASRERMVFQHGAKIPALRRGLSLPMREMEILYQRPYYLFDKGRATTKAYRAQEGVVFVHKLIKDNPGEPHAQVVEHF